MMLRVAKSHIERQNFQLQLRPISPVRKSDMGRGGYRYIESYPYRLQGVFTALGCPPRAEHASRRDTTTYYTRTRGTKAGKSTMHPFFTLQNTP